MTIRSIIDTMPMPPGDASILVVLRQEFQRLTAELLECLMSSRIPAGSTAEARRAAPASMHHVDFASPPRV
jgi:hypothetical protein